MLYRAGRTAGWESGYGQRAETSDKNRRGTLRFSEWNRPTTVAPLQHILIGARLGDSRGQNLKVLGGEREEREPERDWCEVYGKEEKETEDANQISLSESKARGMAAH